MNLSGKKILVTGGTSGIGRATAVRLLAEGAHVTVTGRREDLVASTVAALNAPGWIHGVAADVGTEEGRARTLDGALRAMNGLDILVNNAGGVRAGRLDQIGEADIRAMVDVDLLAPIMLTRAALPILRESGDAMIVNVSSAIALVGIPFYATYAAAKAGLAQFSEALRRELSGEGIRVLTVYPAGTDTPMMASNKAGPDLGFGREPADAVAEAIVEGMKADALTVERGADARAAVIAMNRNDPAQVDARFAEMKPALEDAVKDHAAL
jgi:NAD(P)-dependent dehydrogenase (short-subunit alcohol dehydrogenase family)